MIYPPGIPEIPRQNNLPTSAPYTFRGEIRATRRVTGGMQPPVAWGLVSSKFSAILDPFPDRRRFGYAQFTIVVIGVKLETPII